MSLITAHVLDAVGGAPAAGMTVELRRADAAGSDAPLATALTDADGRVRELGPETLEPGAYAITFGTGAWFADRGTPTFYPEVRVLVAVGADPHYHVPLLLSPFAYSTYRGS
ncbi:5-hydroxyisourate hydrolase [Friedmanniella endophytica]|uniref:5-hydroxyisourate hydrolase n=1 Tax=Microlunatus kandeliicorticis TaxID=1759536 RepID=A0A7W3IUJ1_9ACTN|nr:hydroxyisourate hydrolase [Microlunatus kandeliicorticis]MBA8795487.1 5-hydroxyisourate hydrolase [Microlunatus kandeliicorticis]